VVLGLLLVPWLVREEPIPLQLVEGSRRKLPLLGPDLRAVAQVEGVIKVERDARGRLVVVGERRGETALRIFAADRLTKRFQVRVTPRPPRRIEITPTRVRPPKRRPTRVARPEPPPELRVETPPPQVAPPPSPAPTPLAKLPEPKKDEPPKKPEEKKVEDRRLPPKPPDPGKKMVELDQANRKKPREAKYLAQEDSAVDRETRAIDTTLIKTKPGKEQPDRERRKDRPGDEKAKVAEEEETTPRPARERKVAMAPPIAPRPTPARPTEPRRPPGGTPREAVPDRGREVIRDDIPEGGPRRPFRFLPTPMEIARVLREIPGPAAREVPRDQEERRATKMPGGKWRGIWNKVRGFLENFIPEVHPGTHTALNAQRHAFAAYIARAHRKIHVEWGYGLWQNFRDLPDPLGATPYQSSIFARLEIRLDRQGRITRLGLVRTSGHTTFDGAAMASVLAAAPFGPPPEEMVSRDGITYLHWNFYQDGRQCWTNDVQVFVKDS
jgi:TonB family protein